MSVASDHVAFFRTARTDRYVDTVTITDLTARGAWNRTTKQHGADTTSEVYSGGALIRPAGATVPGADPTAFAVFGFTDSVSAGVATTSM